MDTQPVIDLEKQDADAKVQRLLKLKRCSLGSILKDMLTSITFQDLFTALITLLILVPFVGLLISGNPIHPTHDTLAKVVVGAYIGKIINK